MAQLAKQIGHSQQGENTVTPCLAGPQPQGSYQ